MGFLCGIAPLTSGRGTTSLTGRPYRELFLFGIPMGPGSCLATDVP